MGFRVDEVKLIVNATDHFDHAGGIAALQDVSGARVVASDLCCVHLVYADCETFIAANGCLFSRSAVHPNSVDPARQRLASRRATEAKQPS